MGVISVDIIEGITDRIAAQQALFQTAFASANVSGTGYFYPRIHNGICADPALDQGDADVERALVGVADDLDNNFLSGSTLSNI